MAAADYYDPSGAGSQPPQHSLRPAPPSNTQSHSPLPYPVSDAPPPYTRFAGSTSHSQPPPSNRTSTNYGPPSLNAPPSNGYKPTLPNQPSKMYRPEDFLKPSSQYGPQQGPPLQQQSYFPPPGQSAMNQVYGDGPQPSMPPGYPPAQSPYRYEGDDRDSDSRSHSRHRRHHHHRHHHHHHDDSDPRLQRQKSNGVATFLGAGGGAIIGDAIFPGLGTLGGAILGGIGGHKYEKQRRSYSDSRRDQRYSDEEDYRGRRRD